MNHKHNNDHDKTTAIFKALLTLLALGFALAFCIVVVPPLLADPDVIKAALAGFVNPFAAGYATDTILCWCVLAVWVWFEARTTGMRHGWIALALGVVPGVATGFAVYLLLRLRAGLFSTGQEGRRQSGIQAP